MTATVFLADWTELFTTRQFLGNEPWRWGALLGVLLGSFAVGKTVSFLIEQQASRLKARDVRPLLQVLLTSVARPASMLVLAGGLYLAAIFMRLEISTAEGPVSVRPFWHKVCATIVVIALTWFGYRLVDILEHFLLRWTAKTATALDDQLVPLLRKALRLMLVIAAGLFLVQSIYGKEIGPLLAGVGLGGLAFALAARDLLANIFGSIAIFTDRPFQVGDRVQIKGYDGLVEEVGLRSTRVRTLTGNLVTLPNALVATEPIENIGLRATIRRVLNVTVTYDTPPEKLHRGVEILRDMLAARRGSFPEDPPPQVYFSDFNPDSLNLVVYYWFQPPDWWEYLRFNHEFNTELLKRFNEEGIEFAFPTQTIHLKTDSPDRPGPKTAPLPPKRKTRRRR